MNGDLTFEIRQANSTRSERGGEGEDDLGSHPESLEENNSMVTCMQVSSEDLTSRYSAGSSLWRRNAQGPPFVGRVALAVECNLGRKTWRRHQKFELPCSNLQVAHINNRISKDPSLRYTERGIEVRLE